MRTRAVTASKSQRPGKVRAILASGLVLGIGAAFTLAAWTDDEWVFGGAGPDGGHPGTKAYAMQQNTVAGFPEDKWTDEPEANGGGLDFTIAAASMLPGDTVYAPFQLRTKAGSEALTVKLDQAQQATNDPDIGPANSTDLYKAMRYRAWIGLNPSTCSANGDKSTGTVLVGAGSPLNSTSNVTFILPAGTAPAAAGAPVNLCFAMTLPAGTSDPKLQGLNVVPLWKFTSQVGK